MGGIENESKYNSVYVFSNLWNADFILHAEQQISLKMLEISFTMFIAGLACCIEYFKERR